MKFERDTDSLSVPRKSQKNTQNVILNQIQISQKKKQYFHSAPPSTNFTRCFNARLAA